MNPQTDHTSLNVDPVHRRVMAGVKAHRLKLRVLTTAAFVLGFLAMIASLLVVWYYPIYILPKQRAMEEDTMQLMKQFQTNAIASAPQYDAGKQMGKLLVVQIQVANVITIGTAVVAAAVGLLGLGTLTLLTMVILNRRVALTQISTSLAEISSQLRELEKVRGSS